jgi:predicted enzyme related to lactoylglutathione lyase
MGHPVVRWQIVSPQPDAVTSFYSQLFGWTVGRDNTLGYREITTGDTHGIDGGVWPAPAQIQGSFVQLFVEVPDIDACISEALQLGAKLLVPKSVLPEGDSMAVLLDPTGISVGICQLTP